MQAYYAAIFMSSCLACDYHCRKSLGNPFDWSRNCLVHNRTTPAHYLAVFNGQRRSLICIARQRGHFTSFKND